jgi:hypothetical protein
VAWSILGGHAGYVNFGTSAFFGMGVYTAVFLFKVAGAPLAVQIAAAAAVGALMGLRSASSPCACRASSSRSRPSR